MASNLVHTDDTYTPPDNYLFEPRRKLRVICLGAGFSGMYLAIRWGHKIDNMDLQIYEKNDDVGGTWKENVYPGCACDVPAQIYCFNFEPYPYWSQMYATSQEIYKYMRMVADKYKIRKYIKFESKVTSCIWNEEEAKWHVEIETPEGLIKDTCDVFIDASGILNKWKWPTIPGLHDFKGKLMHSAAYDESADLTGKRVALFGSGSSGIQVVPKICDKVEHLDVYIRSNTWIAIPLADPTSGDELNKDPNPAYTPEMQKEFAENPKKLLAHRKELETNLNSIFPLFTQGSEAQQQVRDVLTKSMKRGLAAKPELAEKLIPQWPVGCRRLTPGVGYLESLCKDNVSPIFSDISKITENAVVTPDGVEHPVDVIIAATGFDVSFKPRFTLKGRGGFELTDEWSDEPRSYYSLGIENMPNYFVVCGPNSPVGNGSLVPCLELMGDYIIKALNKMQAQHIRTIEPRLECIEEYTAHVTAFMENKVWKTSCRSWYKNGKVNGRVTALWSGSTPHFLAALQEPRWEDWKYTYMDSRNRFAYLGNGFTHAELAKGDITTYMQNAEIPPIPEQ